MNDTDDNDGEEPSLFDYSAERAALDEAMQRAADHSDPTWIEAARTTIERLARTRVEFTTDAVWETGLPKPANARRLGPQMTWASKRGLICDSGRFTVCQQAGNHLRPARIWKSLVYEP